MNDKKNNEKDDEKIEFVVDAIIDAPLSRRKFLKWCAFGLGSLIIPPILIFQSKIYDFQSFGLEDSDLEEHTEIAESCSEDSGTPLVESVELCGVYKAWTVEESNDTVYVPNSAPDSDAIMDKEDISSDQEAVESVVLNLLQNPDSYVIYPPVPEFISTHEEEIECLLKDDFFEGNSDFSDEFKEKFNQMVVNNEIDKRLLVPSKTTSETTTSGASFKGLPAGKLNDKWNSRCNLVVLDDAPLLLTGVKAVSTLSTGAVAGSIILSALCCWGIYKFATILNRDAVEKASDNCLLNKNLDYIYFDTKEIELDNPSFTATDTVASVTATDDSQKRTIDRYVVEFKHLGKTLYGLSCFDPISLELRTLIYTPEQLSSFYSESDGFNWSVALDKHMDEILRNGHSIIFDSENKKVYIHFNSKDTSFLTCVVTILIGLIFFCLQKAGTLGATVATVVGAIVSLIVVYAIYELSDKDGNFDLKIDASSFVKLKDKKEAVDHIKKHKIIFILNGIEYTVDLSRYENRLRHLIDRIKSTIEKIKKKFGKKKSTDNICYKEGKHMLFKHPLQNG